jgi:hypothetical protein
MLPLYPMKGPFAAVLILSFTGCGGSTSSGLKDGGATPADAAPVDAGAEASSSGGAKDATATEGSDPGLIACGTTTCSGGPTPGIGQSCCIDDDQKASCVSASSGTCTTHRIGCDEARDCTGEAVCCAEGAIAGGSEQYVTTHCMPSCITGNPRIQVCKTDDECENGSCAAYEGCTPDFLHLRFCQRPETCK